MEIKERKIEKTTYEVKKTYVANDGTEFADMEECKKYEATAKCVIKASFNEVIKSEIHSPDEGLPEFRYCDTVYVVPINNVEDLKKVNMYIVTKGEKLMTSDVIGTTQLIVEDEGGDLYFYGTPEEIKKKFSDGIDSWINGEEGK